MSELIILDQFGHAVFLLQQHLAAQRDGQRRLVCVAIKDDAVSRNKKGLHRWGRNLQKPVQRDLRPEELFVVCFFIRQLQVRLLIISYME